MSGLVSVDTTLHQQLLGLRPWQPCLEQRLHARLCQLFGCAEPCRTETRCMLRGVTEKRCSVATNLV